jgi:hypothetical protein
VTADRTDTTAATLDDGAPVAPRVVVRRRRSTRPDGLRWFRPVIAVTFTIQFLILVAISWTTYRTFTVSIDYGIFAQAASQIGSGNLLPDSTISDTAYLSSHFELIMWPVSLLHRLGGDGFVLLVVQAAALAGTGAAVAVWSVDLVRRSDLDDVWRYVVPGTVVVLAALNPIAYATAAQDFHFWALATLFVVLAARDLTAGRTGRTWLWVALCLSCGDVGGVYAFGVGCSAVLSGRATRRAGLGMMAAGLGWVLLISATGNNNASHIDIGYAYLADRPALDDGAAGFVQMALGTVTDPLTPARLLGDRWEQIGRYLAAGGGFGLLTPWGIGVPVVALLIAGLQLNPIFIDQPFQNFVVTPFVTFGTAWLAVWLLRRGRPPATRFVAGIVLVVAVALGAVVAVQVYPTVFERNGVGGLVDDAQADALAQALAGIPEDAQVVVSVPIMGRFSEHEFVYSLGRGITGGVREIPVRSEQVAFVVDRRNALQLLSPAEQDALLEDLRATGPTEVLVDRDGVTAVLWTAPPGQASVAVGFPE